MITKNLSEGIIEDVSSGVVVSDGPAAKLVICAGDFIPDLDLALF
jgi:hypothetical protein